MSANPDHVYDVENLRDDGERWSDDEERCDDA